MYMKKLIFFILLFLFIIFIFYSPIKRVNTNYKKGKIINIDSYDKLLNYLDNDNINIVVIGKSNCEYCISYDTVLEEIIKNNNYDILSIKLDKISYDEKMKIYNNIYIPSTCSKDNTYKKLINGFGTPLTLFIKDNTSIGCINGYSNIDNTLNYINNIYNKK